MTSKNTNRHRRGTNRAHTPQPSKLCPSHRRKPGLQPGGQLPIDPHNPRTVIVTGDLWRLNANPSGGLRGLFPEQWSVDGNQELLSAEEAPKPTPSQRLVRVSRELRAWSSLFPTHLLRAVLPTGLLPNRVIRLTPTGQQEVKKRGAGTEGSTCVGGD